MYAQTYDRILKRDLTAEEILHPELNLCNWMREYVDMIESRIHECDYVPSKKDLEGLATWSAKIKEAADVLYAAAREGIPD